MAANHELVDVARRGTAAGYLVHAARHHFEIGGRSRWRDLDAAREQKQPRLLEHSERPCYLCVSEFGISLAILLPISTLVFFLSMGLSSFIASGINFGELRTAIPKALALLLAVDLISLLPFGWIPAFFCWLFGLMYLLDLDFWESRFVVFINWFLNMVARIFLITFLSSVILRGIPHGLPLPGPSASQQEKGLEVIANLGGDYDVDEDSPDLPVVKITLAGTRITDADLAHLKTFSKLRVMDLSSSAVTDTGLSHLKGLGQLQQLNLTHTMVTDTGVKYLQKALPRTRIAR